MPPTILLTPDDVGDILQDWETVLYLAPNHDTWPWKSVQLNISSDSHLQRIQELFLNHFFPELEHISLDNSTEDVAYFWLGHSLPRLQHLHGERLLFVPAVPLPPLVELDSCAELDCRYNQQGDRRTLITRSDYPFSMLCAAKDAQSLRLLNSFIPLFQFDHGTTKTPIILFPNLQEVSIEDEWEYISQGLAYLAFPPMIRLTVFAHTNRYEFDLWGKKGFWFDILPKNHAETLPMLAATRALQLILNLHLSEDETADGIPYTNGALLSGALDPSGLYDGESDRHMLPGGSWSVAVTNCQEFCSEVTPVTLREIPALVDCTRLLHLEMHTQPYLMDVSGNEWRACLLRHLVALESLEVGGLRSIQMVIFAMEEDTALVLPSLTHLTLCHAELPSQYPLDPKDILDMVREREQHWNRPLPKLTMRVPDQARGRLAGNTVLIPRTLHLVMQVLTEVEGGSPAVEVQYKYCQCCHDDDPESALPPNAWESTVARYMAGSAKATPMNAMDAFYP
ncbi:hypothetical protein GSI_10419 [Ganoderma sinense ZZ0214-1]|uniref:Uncharacterized protein n=1 Tax=Ganoderma sinense ZZ0214-1 TaxID=1077348 RepID=A0A2G8S0H5_9APHY|nr:hypothetical protein GSI_10419 [Ganoderma sinense ZZ0214-1]